MKNQGKPLPMHLTRPRRLHQGAGFSLLTVCLSLISLSAAFVAQSRAVGAQPPAATPALPPPKTALATQQQVPLKVVVSIAPLKGLVEPLLPPGSTIELMIPPGVSEHGYEPPPSKLAALAQADLVVIVGRGLEPQVEKFMLEHPSPRRRTIKLSDLHQGPHFTPGPQPAAPQPADEQHNKRGNTPTIQEIFPHQKAPADRARDDSPAEQGNPKPTPAHDHKHDHNHDADHAHDHDHDHDHVHGGADPHLWLDPTIAIALVREVDIMINRPATRVDGYVPSTAAAHLTARIIDIDLRYRAMMLKSARKVCIVAHDAWSIPATRYGFTTIPMAGLHASEPTPKSLAAAATAARERGVTMIFTEPQLSDRAAKRIAKVTKLKIGTLDPLGDGDWFLMMEKNLAAFTAAFE